MSSPPIWGDFSFNLSYQFSRPLTAVCHRTRYSANASRQLYENVSQMVWQGRSDVCFAEALFIMYYNKQFNQKRYIIYANITVWSLKSGPIFLSHVKKQPFKNISTPINQMQNYAAILQCTWRIGNCIGWFLKIVQQSSMFKILLWLYKNKYVIIVIVHIKKILLK